MIRHLGFPCDYCYVYCCSYCCYFYDCRHEIAEDLRCEYFPLVPVIVDYLDHVLCPGHDHGHVRDLSRHRDSVVFLADAPIPGGYFLLEQVPEVILEAVNFGFSVPVYVIEV